MEAILEKARSYLDAHRGERVTLEQLAGAVHAQARQVVDRRVAGAVLEQRRIVGR